MAKKTALRRGSQQEGNTDYFTGCPIGGGFIWFGLPDKIPTNCKICDNSTLAISQFAKLYENIGSSWGESGGNINIPDLRGRFPRGVDADANRDLDKASRTAENPGGNTGNAVGSAQGDAIRNISGELSGVPITGNPTPTGPFTFSGTYSGAGQNAQGHYRCFMNASLQVPTGQDNRPKNTNVYFVIRVE